MQAKRVAGVLLAIVFLSHCFQDAEATFKLKKLIKAGLIIKALSPRRTILPIPIPIPIKVQKDNHHYHDTGYGGYGHGYGGGYGHGYGGGYGGGYGHGYGGGYGHGYGGGYGHGGYQLQDTGYHFDHSW